MKYIALNASAMQVKNFKEDVVVAAGQVPSLLMQ